MRIVLSAMGGVLLALALFSLLALLVAPPRDDRQPIEPATPVRLVAAQSSPKAAQSSPEAAQSSPETAPAPPDPAPRGELAVETPEPESESAPEPTPESAPEPEPTPEPESPPEPDPRPWVRDTTAAASDEATPATSRGDTGPEGETSDKGKASGAEADGEAARDVRGAPAPTLRVPPEYPTRARRRGVEGYVEVRFTIRPDGRVEPGTLEVVEAQPRRAFDEAARRAIARWEFPPAARSRIVTQRLEFRLR